MDEKHFDRMRVHSRRMDFEHYAVYVFPIGARHLKRFSTAVSSVIKTVTEVRVKHADPTEKELYGAIAAAVMPHLLGDLLGLVESTCVVGNDDEKTHKFGETMPLDEIPHWDLAPVIEAWWELNFDKPEKRRPWARAIEKIVSRITNKPFQLSELFSKASSSPAIVDTTSSIDDSPPKTELPSPTEGGQKTSSNSGQSNPEVSSAASSPT